MKRARTAFIALDQVAVHEAAGWVVVSGEKRKAGGVWQVLMAAPARLPVWWRLRARLGLGGYADTHSHVARGAGACFANDVHGSDNKPARSGSAPRMAEVVP